MTDRPYSILILCTGNTSRSVMAEALFNVLGNGRFRAYSAGSRPAGVVNPFAIEQCAALGYDTSQLRSKSWDEFARPGAPQMDFVLTVCDAAAGEACPVWPGRPIAAHWGFEDPAACAGSDDEKRSVFDKVRRQIAHRVSRFLALPLDAFDRDAIRRAMRAIGEEPAEACDERH
ncbi:arsenate reductase ArsC [Burkholderia multivorans]|uniref:arsenate reductase ArsC n=1 Tax=Burkholderia multivorans TaxID=87883 RepID=UPI000CFFD87A|nr:arsenate reductase ArsC [Burkholderia multivorans]MBU9670630.1 arsenate reductase ArsC [Burkholderia multivorans]PRF28796.1 protein-tyrosine-phosphatase [Burkholderia multivorans]HEF4755609.1 arsenate reductase ArsC [Burkholderia multivorans]